MSDPYQSSERSSVPTRPADEAACKRRFWWRLIWVAVVGVIVPPVLAVAGTVVGMIRAFSVLGDTGAADPSALAGNISVALLSTFYSLIIAVPAFVFLVFAIVRYNRLPKRS